MGQSAFRSYVSSTGSGLKLRHQSGQSGPALAQFNLVVLTFELNRFNALGRDCAADTAHFPNLHFLDTMGIPLLPAALGATADSGDWVNEIHLNRNGLKKFSPRYAALVELVLQQQGLPA